MTTRTDDPTPPGADDEVPRYSVLLVEDNPGDADLARVRLSEATDVAFDVTEAPTLAEALRSIDAKESRAILLDLNLPDSTGLETLRRVRSASPSAPILVVSGGVDAELADRLRAEGADEVLTKDDGNAVRSLTERPPSSVPPPRDAGDPEPNLVMSPLAMEVLRAIERRRSREHAQALELLVEKYPDAVLILSGEGAVRYANHAAVELFARSREELARQRVDFPLVDGPPMEMRLDRDGRARVLEVRTSTVKWNMRDAWLAICRDVTDRKQAELKMIAADRLASLGTLVAGVAHEINNPLAAVLANLGLLREGFSDLEPAIELPPELHAMLDDAVTSAERVRGIVRDLKVFSRADDEARAGPVDVEALLDFTLRVAANETGARARVVRAYGRVPHVQGNEGRLGQVFLNLVVNAAHAIPEGRVEENEIRVGTSEDHDGRIVVSVADTGEGIPHEVQARIFTPFFTTKAVGEGTGLGLALSHSILVQMGGTIAFTTVVGKGTEFRVSLPRAASAPARVSAPHIEVAPARRGRVLVIDDDEVVARVVAKVLASSHDVVVESSSARAVDRLLGGERFDVVLCDLMMSELTGMDVYEVLREKLPVILERMVFVTGGAYTPRARAFLDQVPNKRVEKPFSAKSLRAIVNDYVR